MRSDAKQCCARLYEHELVTRLLGESFHPGGAALTERLGELLHLTPDMHVLDVAAGRGISALVLARRFGCRVTAMDLSASNIGQAKINSAAVAAGDRVNFTRGDAEQIPLSDGSIDAIICECAFCTFPDKAAAAGEFARVLKASGRIGMSDLTRTADSTSDFADLMSWIACIGGAMGADQYAEWLASAGLQDVVIELHDGVLLDMVNDIGKRLLASELLVGLNNIEIPGVDFPAAKRVTRQALDAVRTRRLGYAIVVARKGFTAAEVA